MPVATGFAAVEAIFRARQQHTEDLGRLLAAVFGAKG